MVQNRLVLRIHFLRAQNESLVYGAGAAWSCLFCLEPESALRDLGHPEPEPPKKVAASQHCG